MLVGQAGEFVAVVAEHVQIGVVRLLDGAVEGGEDHAVVAQVEEAAIALLGGLERLLLLLQLGDVADDAHEADRPPLQVPHQDGAQADRRDRAVLAHVLLLVFVREAARHHLGLDDRRFACAPLLGREVLIGVRADLVAVVADEVEVGLVHLLDMAIEVDEHDSVPAHVEEGAEPVLRGAPGVLRLPRLGQRLLQRRHSLPQRVHAGVSAGAGAGGRASGGSRLSRHGSGPRHRRRAPACRRCGRRPRSRRNRLRPASRGR